MNFSRRILMVCLGNICRSPAAESVLRAKLSERGVADQVAVDSAGLLDYHRGSLPDSRSLKALEQRGYHSEHRARQVTVRDLEDFDHIVVMEPSQIRELGVLVGKNRGKARLSELMTWASKPSFRYVPDPYYGTQTDFERMMDLIEEGCEGLADALVEELYQPG
jgi:protein-tyrosine phosphatase